MCWTKMAAIRGTFYVPELAPINMVSWRHIPAWSLHRLIKLAYGNWDEDIVPIYLGNSYDMLIGRIEFQIKQGKFNKDYLIWENHF